MRFPAAPIWIALALLVPAIASAQNNPPVVDAGPDQTIFLGDSVTLHGTATGDPGLWQWEVVSAPTGSNYNLFDADIADATFSTDTLGYYVITLTAWNYFGWSDPDAVVVTVVQNEPPTAIASATPLAGTAPLLVDLDGTLSFDPEGASLLYDWDFGDMMGSTDPAPAHQYTLPGVYTARLIVADDRGNIDVDTVEINVTEPPPVPALSPPSIAVLALLLLGSAAFTLRRVRGEPH